MDAILKGACLNSLDGRWLADHQDPLIAERSFVQLRFNGGVSGALCHVTWLQCTCSSGALQQPAVSPW
jgi:hypothetical protein